MERPDPIATARTALSDLFPNAALAFLSGSVVRGEATATSDLDLVVVFRQVDRAYRRSLTLDGWPIEAFVHDPATLRYVMEEADRSRGVPSMPHMVADGIPLPGPSELSERLKEQADAVLESGPPPLNPEELLARRYAITDLIEDLVEPRSAGEARATGARLYGVLADFTLRARGEWSATGKTIPRRLRTVDADLAERYDSAFESLFSRLDSRPVIALADSVLRPFGGILRDGYEALAPVHWRKE